ncbi:MAG: putative lipoprotein [Treponematales bacterium]
MILVVKRLFPAGLAAVLFVCSCASVPVVISEGLTSEELIQWGQEAVNRSRYGQALEYYNAVIERFPMDLEVICAAEYEIAFIYYKQGKYEEARRKFNSLLVRYEVADAEILPQQYRILANKVLERMSRK